MVCALLLIPSFSSISVISTVPVSSAGFVAVCSSFFFWFFSFPFSFSGDGLAFHFRFSVADVERFRLFSLLPIFRDVRGFCFHLVFYQLFISPDLRSFRLLPSFDSFSSSLSFFRSWRRFFPRKIVALISPSSTYRLQIALFSVASGFLYLSVLYLTTSSAFSR
jgi:hypothetical protein